MFQGRLRCIFFVSILGCSYSESMRLDCSYFRLGMFLNVLILRNLSLDVVINMVLTAAGHSWIR